MTETGMILSNPYRGERRPGSVGLPLPGVEVRTREDGALPPSEGRRHLQSCRCCAQPTSQLTLQIVLLCGRRAGCQG